LLLLEELIVPDKMKVTHQLNLMHDFMRSGALSVCIADDPLCRFPNVESVAACMHVQFIRILESVITPVRHPHLCSTSGGCKVEQ
jgi:hypothetical protein